MILRSQIEKAEIEIELKAGLLSLCVGRGHIEEHSALGVISRYTTFPPDGEKIFDIIQGVA